MLSEYAASINSTLSDDQLKSFHTYLEQLQLWNRSTNLTSITSAEDIASKHFVDSIAALQAEHMRPGASLLDVGSGAGFPGIPLQIVRPDLNVTLVESAPKKTSFLHFMVGSLQLGRTRVYNGTWERFFSDCQFQPFDYIAIRALRYEAILDQARSCLVQDGKVILYLSKPFDAGTLTRGWLIDKQISFELPRSKGQRTIAVLKPDA